MKDKAAIYLRVSTDVQDEENQLKDCRDLCESEGWEIVEIFRDHGISAYKDIDRPDFNRMIKDARKKRFDHIVVFSLDRFSRQPPADVLELIKELRLVFGVEVNAAHGDEWRDAVEMINKLPTMGFLAKAMAEMLEKVIVGLQAYNARQESEKISDRTRSSKKFQKAKAEGRIGRPQLQIDNDRILECKRQNPSWSIRRIAAELDVSKYAVEQCLKNGGSK